MRSRLQVIILISSATLMMFVTRATNSFFTDAAQTSPNTFTVVTSVPTPTETNTPTPSVTVTPTLTSTPTPTNTPTNTPTPTATNTPTPSPTLTPTPTGITQSNIVINELYSATSTNSAEWVEIYNPTNQAVNVSGWKIKDADSEDIFPSVTPIPSGGYAVIVTNNTTVSGISLGAITITINSLAIGSGLNVGGDAVILTTDSNTVVDQMSYGSNISVFPSPPPAPNLSQTLRRSPNGVDTDTSSDWSVTSVLTIGSANN